MTNTKDQKCIFCKKKIKKNDETIEMVEGIAHFDCYVKDQHEK